MNKFSCNVNPTGDRYIFYENIHKYLKYRKICINDNNCNQYRDKCEFKGLTFDGKENVHTNICKRFKYLIYNILNEAHKHNYSIEKADGEYLNYWLNHEILMNDANICPKVFLQHMITRDTGNILLRELKNYMYYIEDDDVKNMYNLFYIYQHYNDFKETMDSEYPNKDTAIKYITHCTQKYKELKAKYSEKNTHLSNALNTFKTKYEQTELYKAKLLEWKIEKLPSLDDPEDIQEKVTELSNMNISPAEITTEPSVSLGQPALTQSTSSATFAQPAAPMQLFAETVIVQSESGKSNPSDQIQSLQPALTVSTFAATSAHPAALTNPFAESGKSHFSPHIQSLQSGDNPVRSEENGSTGLKGEGDLSDYTRTIIGPTIGTIGMSSIFFIFYKFTSFGVWLFRGRRNNKQIRMNFDEQRNLFLDTSEYHYEYPSSESYNIAYNSA
ncbi:PIR protein [Plasmodium vivax]|uniref:VIR protein n=1 Tax=Plasmodium vivax TaxID=5855 RepID=A0A565A5P5_PLAVI|nr:PIR protein [Plasmodium vivax]